MKKISTDKAPAAIGPYSQAIIAGEFLYASGQIPINPATGNVDAEGIAEVFGKEEIDRIYLNFSDPWPKDRHAKRRLPSREFLKRYDSFLKKDGVLEFKTDNRDLFNFALEELNDAGWEAVQVTYDLHNDPVMLTGNIMTEYEEKFSALGNPIYKYIIKR